MQHLNACHSRLAATPNRAWAHCAYRPARFASVSFGLRGMAVVLPFIGGGQGEDSPLGCTSQRARGRLC